MKPVHTIPIVQIISCKMLATSRSLKMLIRVSLLTIFRVSLNTSHIGHCIFPCNQWILSRCLLPSPPSWVPKYIDVWSPKRQATCLPIIVNCSSFSSNSLSFKTFTNNNKHNTFQTLTNTKNK